MERRVSCELHKHSTWSLLDGVGTAEHGARRAAELGHPALAMTEHAVLSGVVHHIDACHEVGITPIVGVEAYYRERRQPFDKETNWEYFHMLLLAKNIRGWRSLKLLTSEAYRSGLYRKPCIDDELLDKWHEGLFISTSCVSGFVPRAILRGDSDAVKRHCDKLTRWVGDDWYFEIQPHDFDDLRAVNLEIPSLAAVYSRPIVAARDAHAPDETWIETQHVSVKIRTRGSMVSAPRKEGEADEKYELTVADTAYIDSADQTVADFRRYHPRLDHGVIIDAVKNTDHIAGQVVPWMIDKSPKLPRYSADDPNAELRRQVYAGLAELGHDGDPRYVEAIEKELDIYRQRGVASFFLIVGRLVRACRQAGHKVGLGRGSAGGCATAYALRITLINPINYGLRFERFLNPDREGLPDIDIDLTREGAEFAKAWLKREYGDDRVYDLISHGTLGAKAAIRRVGMVYEIPHPQLNVVSKLLPDDGSSLTSMREDVPELDKFADDNPAAFAHAVRLQGSIGTISEHAAGVVLSGQPLDELLPVMKKSAKDDYLVTAFGESADKPIISDLGFLKIDLLVVIALARQAYAEQLIGRVHDVVVDLDTLPAIEDPRDVDSKTMDIFAQGRIRGVFQWDGFSNMASITKQIKPESIHHLAAANAGVRPGVSKQIDEYVRRRHGAEFEYWDPSVEPALKETYGLPLYQEQIMAIFEHLGGYSAAEADTVRRIMGKYYRIKGDVAARMLGAHQERFVENASRVCRGGRSLADQIWNYCGGSSEYLFNKCTTGDTVVERGGGGGRHSGPNSAKITIKDLYDAWNSSTPVGVKLRRQGVTLLQMQEDGRVRPGRCVGIYYQGSKPVYQITTESGRSIKVTANHRMLTADGSYRRCDEIEVGDRLIAEPGCYEGYQRKGNQTERARGKRGPFKPGDQNVAYIDGRHMILEETKRSVADRAGGICEQCSKPSDGRTHDLEFAHIKSLDGCGENYSAYNSPANVKHLCNSCHKRMDYRKGERVRRWAKGRRTFSDAVASIQYVGEAPVYDVEMAEDDHNFIANGLVSHNSHADEYSLIAYCDAWLKAHHPDAFYASLLTFPPAWVKKPEHRNSFYERVVRESRSFGVDILPPDVNESDEGFTIRGDAVRFGMKGIKGLGPAMVADVLSNRPFASIEDMGARLNTCNAAGRHALAQAGAMDRFGARANLTEDERSQFEEDRIGVALSTPDRLVEVREELRMIVHTQDEVEAAPNGSALVVGGEVISGREVKTRKGPSLKLTVAFDADEYQVSVAPWFYDDALRELIATDEPIVVRGAKDTAWDCVSADEIKLAREVLDMMRPQEIADATVCARAGSR
jgi:DNA-directed DNA polymerase III PolC